MPISDERPPQDAPASLDTGYCFVPDANGSFSRRSGNNEFEGTLSTSKDEDWIAIDLKAGTEYTFKVGGNTGEGMLNDSILKLLDYKGNEVDMNDDINGSLGKLGSSLKFTAEADGRYYVSVSAYQSANVDNKGAYALVVEERPAGPKDIDGATAPSKLTGTDEGEVITGGGGDDVLRGRGGDDTLNGGGGNDLLEGGPGADIINGGPDIDVVSYRGSAEGVTVNLRALVAQDGDADGDTLRAGLEWIEGSMHADDLTGDDDPNSIWGLAGDDELDGGDGDDTLEGGAGADMLIGGDSDPIVIARATMATGGDTASWAGSTAGVTVRLHNQVALGGDAEGDTFAMESFDYTTLPDRNGDSEERTESLPDIENLMGSDHDDILTGDFRDNRIMGGAGDDTLYGGPGGGDGSGDDSNDDYLDGGSGNDRLFGGAGDDWLLGGEGDDVLWGGPGIDILLGYAGK